LFDFFEKISFSSAQSNACIEIICSVFFYIEYGQCVVDLTARLSWIKWENLGVIGTPAVTSFAPVPRWRRRL